MATNVKGVDDVRNSIARTLGRSLIPALLWLLILTLPATGNHREPPSRLK